MATEMVDAKVMENGGYAGDSSYHDNVNVGVERKERGLAQRARHGHVGNTLHVVSEEVQVDTITGKVW